MFLDAVPEAKAHMDKLRALSPTWNRLVDNWDLIESTFIEEVGFNWQKGNNVQAIKTYDLMHNILYTTGFKP